MATKKEKDPIKKESKKETKPKEELIETPIPDPEPFPEGVVEGEPDILPKDEIDEMIETPVPEPDLEPAPIPKAKPEKLGTLVIDESLDRAECKKEELGLITTADLKMPAIAKRNKAHDAANDTIITTGDFKPRKWGKSRKL